MKDFIEAEQKEIMDLKCINGAMYFGCVDNPCPGRETGECCHNEQTWDEAEKELKDFLRSHDQRLIDKIVEMVEGKRIKIYESNKWGDYERGVLEGHNQAINDILTSLK